MYIMKKYFKICVPVTMTRVWEFIREYQLAMGQFGYFPQAQCTVLLLSAIRILTNDLQMLYH